MTADLRGYLSQVSKAKELAIVKKRVSTKYEIAAVTAKLDGSKAVLFENIKESKFRVVSNLVGTKKRFALAVGADRRQDSRQSNPCDKSCIKAQDNKKRQIHGKSFTRPLRSAYNNTF